MKRLLILLFVAGLLAAIPLSHVATAAKPETKVAICHVNSANDVLDLGETVVTFGRVINVSENALEAHLAHGDSTDFIPVNKCLRDKLEELFDIRLPNANCGIVVSEPEPGPE